MKVQIHNTTDYEKFNIFDVNRQVSEDHVLKLVNDPTFPDKQCFSPILVDSNFNIIDGQHRLQACMRLNIAVHYIVDPNATVTDIRDRNRNMKPWKVRDFIEYYAKLGKKDYQFFLSLMEEHTIIVGWLGPIVIKLCNFNNKDYSYKLTDGKLSIMKHKDQLVDICSKIFPVLKNYITLAGQKRARVLFTVNFLTAITHYYIHDRRIFNKFLENIFHYEPQIIPSIGFEDARNQVKKISGCREFKKKEQMDLFERCA